jgi:LAO/AO transport system kinase
MPLETSELARAVAAAEKSGVARALNLVEDKRPQALTAIGSLLEQLTPRAAMQRVGLTGPPGVGKSTLTSALALELRARGRSVGVLAVDPSSVRSGGALLGDRVRMGFDPSDQQLFMRSLATAGDTGGLARAAGVVVEVFSAAYDRVLVETVGVGQSETAVEHVVDTVCLVVQPGSGDALQFIKAGIMEIPDVIVVNKGDHKALAERAASDARAALAKLGHAGMRPGDAGWRVPVLVTSARDRIGIDALADTLEAHRASFDAATLTERRLRGSATWSCALFQRLYGEHGLELMGGAPAVFDAVLSALQAGRPSVAAVAALGERLLEQMRQAVPKR